MYVPRSAMVEGVRTVKDFSGLTGTFTCDAVGECNASGPIFVVVKDGQWVVASNN
jgi:branched-chain amino acid transport system substrate-binding protein